MKKRKYRILCVDDDKEFLDSMKVIVENEGYLVETANTSEEGKRKFKDTNPDLVIVDLMMEEIDTGTALVKDIRAMGGKQPVFMLSSVGDKLNSNIDYTELGLSGIMQKPVNPKTLIATLKARLKD